SPGIELGCLKWKFETYGAVSSSVTIHDDRIHIACEDANLYALDANGVMLWSYDANSPLLSSPTIGRDGTVYVGSEDGNLYAVDSNGYFKWEFVTDGPVYSSPALAPDGNTIYACSVDGSLYALEPNGMERWAFSPNSPGTGHKGSILASPAVAADGTIFICQLYDPNLYALNPNDGSIKWNCPFDPNVWPFASPVLAPDGTIYQTLTYDPNLYAIDSNNGDILWSLNLSDPCSGWFEVLYDHPAAGSQYYLNTLFMAEVALGQDGTIYASLDDPYLRAIDPNGSIKWVKRLGMVGGFTMTVGNDGLIYAASDDNYLCVVKTNGEEIARFKTDDWLNYPVYTDDNTVIVSGGEKKTGLKAPSKNAVFAIATQPCAVHDRDLHRLQDLNGDNIVNLVDYSFVALKWLLCSDTARDYINMSMSIPRCDYSGTEIYYTGDVDRNLHVDTNDLMEIVENWLQEN
ncbi:MAG: outer membrane protein assembly factor BamB family protein, partial [Planctomycetota bacterium]